MKFFPLNGDHVFGSRESDVIELINFAQYRYMILWAIFK